jgi:dTMP kinase
VFITFEGIEGCGKTTQIERLAKRLRVHKIPLTLTLEPGGTNIGKSIRQMLLDARNTALSPLTELILFAADRAQHVEEVIKPALDQGNWVISDRFFDATVSYQGATRGQDMKFIRILNDKITQGIRPDITILLDCPVEMGLDRAIRRNKALPHKGQDRFEREKPDFHEEVRKGYLELAHKDKKRFVIIDATLTEDEVEKEIFEYLRPFLEM